MIERITSVGSLDTHETTYFRLGMKSLYQQMFKLSGHDMMICDPFARNCRIAGEYTNDIDPDTAATHHLDALDFMCSQQSGFFDGVIFDPPFSPHQAERYEVGHQNIYTTPGYVKQIMQEIERVLKPGGYMLKFGFNSTRHSPNFDLVKMWVVNIGGNHNDTIMTLWHKNTQSLEAWL